MLTTAQQYTLLLRCALVAGVFAFLAATLLLVDYAARVATDPLNTPEFLALKAELKENPRDEAIKAELRLLDLELRNDYFQRRRFSTWGTWLLVTSGIVTLACAKAAAVLRRRLPQPQSRDVPPDLEGHLQGQSRWSVAALGGVLVVCALGLWASGRGGHEAAPILMVDASGEGEPGTPPVAGEPASPEPASPEPASPEPASPEPASPEPASPEPASPEPAAPEPPAPEPPAPEPPAPEPKPPSTSPEMPPTVDQAPVAPDPSTSKPPAPAPKVAPAPSGPPAPAVAAEPSGRDAWQRNWPRFRGPEGTGVTAHENPPTAWDGAAGEGVLWKTAIPLPGNASPIVWGDRVFVTGADESRRVVYGCDAETGKLLWEAEAPGTPASTAAPPKVMEATGYAAPTPATDGQRVYAMFANGDLVAVDFAGQVSWSRSFGLPKNAYGHAASLAMHNDLLLVQFDQGTRQDKLSKLSALKAASGEVAWETPREVPNSWTTPIVIEHEGRAQIITAADPYVIAYAPADGQELWRAKCLQGDVGPSPTFANGTVYVANEFPGMAAIRADGTGDVTETHVMWEADIGSPDTSSPLALGDLLLVLASYGTLTCYDGSEGGEPLWEEDFDGNFSSSPAAAGELVYLFDETGKAYIIKPTAEECQRVSEADLGEECVTSPAFQPGRIYIRGREHLYCLE